MLKSITNRNTTQVDQFTPVNNESLASEVIKSNETFPDSQIPIKRKAGRPKGSKNIVRP